jgi:hypothetical protein
MPVANERHFSPFGPEDEDLAYDECDSCRRTNTFGNDAAQGHPFMDAVVPYGRFPLCGKFPELLVNEGCYLICLTHRRVVWLIMPRPW